jgi:hypothetical protein
VPREYDVKTYPSAEKDQPSPGVVGDAYRASKADEVKRRLKLD